MAPCKSRPLELNALQTLAVPPLSSVGPSYTPPPQTEPATVASWVWRGAVTLQVGAKKASLEDQSFATRTTEKLFVEKSRIGDSRRGCVCGPVSTQASPVRGTDVKMLDHTPSSSSQLERHRKLHHLPFCPNVSSCLGVESGKAVGLIPFWPKGLCVCHPTPTGMGEATGLIFVFLN